MMIEVGIDVIRILEESFDRVQFRGVERALGPSRTGFQPQDIHPTVDFTHRRVEQAELGHCLRGRSLLIHEAIVLVDGHRSLLIYVHIGAVDAQVQ